ncbi:DUF4190 domain-containing protein [Agromyces sp. LHK192]|uniref:DUF4190 domain-containing protein n=1 Tax=Agromyces sp. LHK192 TaxID=2498704 RepID=UPI000FD6FDC4|nr:DUF4190 domain-containing protein [Agromyces sp. LHK192]
MTDPNAPGQPTPPANGTPAAPPPYGGAPVPPPAPPAAPAYGAPAGGQQPYGAPAYGAPAYGAPAYGAPAYGGPPAAPRTNVLAIVSLVSAFFISLAAIITGHIALNQIKKTGENGRGLAIAGLIIGYVGLVAGIIFFVVYVVIIIGLAATSGVTTY